MTDVPEETREDVIDGLRQFADFLEAHPDLPPPDEASYVGPYLRRETEEQERAEVDRIARILGVDTVASAQGHYSAERRFGAIEYSVVAIPRQQMERYQALMTYRDAVAPDPATASGGGTPTWVGLPEEGTEAAIGGLRALADFLEAHPDLPEPFGVSLSPDVRGATYEQEKAEVDRIARILGVRPTTRGENQYLAVRYFGPVEYEAVAISPESMEGNRALMTYTDAVTP